MIYLDFKNHTTYLNQSGRVGEYWQNVGIATLEPIELSKFFIAVYLSQCLKVLYSIQMNVKFYQKNFNNPDSYHSRKVVRIKLRQSGQDSAVVVEDVLLAIVPLPLATAAGGSQTLGNKLVDHITNCAWQWWWRKR